MKKTILFSAMFAAVFGWSQQIDNVTVRQRWPWNNLVDINYVLTAQAGQSYDITVQAFNGGESLTIPTSAFTGDIYGVTEGARRIVFDPSKMGVTNVQMLTQFKIQLESASADLYIIVDLQTGAVQKLFKPDLASGAYGAVVTNVVGGYQTLVWTDITNNPAYKTTQMVFRRVPKGIFQMGSGGGKITNQVTITKDFYMAVFETTQGQWKTITGSYDSYFKFVKADIRDYRPADYMSYDYIRGSTAQGINWPLTGTNVVANGFIDKARRKINNKLALDMPTEAQWEYACRAGTDTVFNDGNSVANVTGANAETNQWLSALGRYKWNGGAVWNGSSWTQPALATTEANEGIAPVGLYAPNNWGLYDMHGNAAEFCLDWYDAALSENSDPRGPATGTKRCTRGGFWWTAANGCMAYNRASDNSNTFYWYTVRFTAPVSW